MGNTILCTLLKKFYTENSGLINFIKNSGVENFENRYVKRLVEKNFDLKDKLEFGKVLVRTNSSLHRYKKFLKFDTSTQNFLNKMEELGKEAGGIVRRPHWFRNVNWAFSYMKSIHITLKWLMHNYNIKLTTEEILNTNRPFLEGMNAINLTDFAIRDLEEFNKIRKKYQKPVPIKINFNKIAKKLFPDSEFVMHSNVSFGLASPYDVIKKLLVDLVLVLDIVLVEEITEDETIANLLDIMIGGGHTSNNLLACYNEMGYPLPSALKHYKAGCVGNWGAHNPAAKIIKQTAPFIIGKELTNPDVGEVVRSTGIRHKVDTPRIFFD